MSITVNTNTLEVREKSGFAFAFALGATTLTVAVMVFFGFILMNTADPYYAILCCVLLTVSVTNLVVFFIEDAAKKRFVNKSIVPTLTESAVNIRDVLSIDYETLTFLGLDSEGRAVRCQLVKQPTKSRTNKKSVVFLVLYKTREVTS